MKTQIKISIVLMLITCYVNTSFSQEYQSLFGEKTTYWTTKLNIDFPVHFSDSIVYVKDTSINDRAYKKFKRFRLDSGRDYYVFEDDKDIFIYENLQEGKAYIKEGKDVVDHLFYDLNLEVGDTFTDCIVDSVFVKDGKKHIRCDCNPDPLAHVYEKFTIIEGVGTNRGLLYYYSPSQMRDVFVLCQHKDGVLTYMNNHPTYAGRCSRIYYPDDNIEDNISPSIDISPNPASESLFLEYDNSNLSILRVDILSLESKRIKSFIDNFQTLDVSDIPKGLYILRIITDKSSVSKKILID